MREEREAAEGVVIDAPESIARAEHYLRNLVEQGDVAIEGSGGNDRTFRLAAQLRDMGLSIEQAIETSAPWNAACAPPWDLEEYEAVFTNVYEYAQNEAGAKAHSTDGTAFASLPVPPKAPAGSPNEEGVSDRFTPLSIPELESLPDPEWLVPDILPAYSLSVIYGPPGAMKSFMALDMALSIAAGQPCLDLAHEQRAHPTIYAAGEGQIGIAKQRVPAWIQAKHDSNDLPFHFIREVPRADAGAADLAAFFAAIEEKCAGALPRLIVLDTHARIMSGLDENSVQDTSLALDVYSAIIKRYSCSVLVVHHTGKDGGRERGSNALRAATDAMFKATYDQDARTAVLRCERMKDAEEFKPMGLTPVRSGPSVVLRKKEVLRPTPGRSELYTQCVGILAALGATSPGTAVTTAVLASGLADLHEEPTEEARQAAKRSAETTLRRASRGELRPIAVPDRDPVMWALPSEGPDA